METLIESLLARAPISFRPASPVPCFFLFQQRLLLPLRRRSPSLLPFQFPFSLSSATVSPPPSPASPFPFSFLRILPSGADLLPYRRRQHRRAHVDVDSAATGSSSSLSGFPFPISPSSNPSCIGALIDVGRSHEEPRRRQQQRRLPPVIIFTKTAGTLIKHIETKKDERSSPISGTKLDSCCGGKDKMPHRTRPMTALLVFMGVNVVLVSTITPVYDFVCFHPCWERKRVRHHREREASMTKDSQTN